VAGAAAGLKTIRSIPMADLFLVGGTAVTAAPVATEPQRFGARLGAALDRLIGAEQWQWILLCLLTPAAGAWITTAAVPPTIPQSSAAFKPPFKAIRFIEKTTLHGNLLNDPHFGATMIWQMHDNPPVFIDPRYNLFGNDLLQDYWKMVQCRDNWQGLLDKYQIGWTFLPPDLKLNAELAKSADWRLVYSDEASVIYERKQSGVKSDSRQKK
jgi:hypothetical protein